MATPSSILAWRTPGMEEPGGLLTVVLQSQTQLKRLSSSSQCSYLKNPMDRAAWQAVIHGVAKSRTQLRDSAHRRAYRHIISFFFSRNLTCWGSKTLSHKTSERSSLVTGPRLNSSPPEAKNLGIFYGSATTFQHHTYLFICEFIYLFIMFLLVLPHK